jgi:hypothetical protein
MKKFYGLLLIALGFMGALTPATPALADNDKFPGYEKIGSKKVDFVGDKDTVEITSKEGRFTSIYIAVDDGDLVMHDINIVFGDGTKQSPDVRVEFEQGSRSRKIDLEGEARFIKEVNFKYRSKVKGFKGKATVEIWGKNVGGGGNDGPDKPLQYKGYEHLGTRKVDFLADKDTIEVGAKDGTFTGAMITCEDGEVEMWNVKFEFGNGSDMSPDTRWTFKEGARSQMWDFPGEARNIKKVSFWYKSKLKEGKATIRLYGKQGSGEATPHKEPKDRFPGWEHLGTRKVEFLADKDTINCEGEGAFTSFKVEVEEGNVEMWDIQVTFGNDDEQDVKTRLEFDENTRSRDIDLTGKARKIKKIVFKYKSKIAGFKGKATINVYGKKA